MEPAQEGETEDALAIALKALAHPNRLHLLRFTTEPRTIEEIASELGLARQSAQAHLDQLLELGVVEARRGRGDRGPVTYYVVVVARLFEIYDRLGMRLGILATEMDEDVRSHLPTSPLAPGATPAAAPATPRVTIVHGMRVGLTVPLLGNGPWLIGRDPAAQISLDYDPFVSNRHAELRRSPRGGFELADMFSSNGVWVDWAKLPRGGQATLASGSLLRIGKTLLHFRTP